MSCIFLKKTSLKQRKKNDGETSVFEKKFFTVSVVPAGNCWSSWEERRERRREKLLRNRRRVGTTLDDVVVVAAAGGGGGGGGGGGEGTDVVDLMVDVES